jgi:hypothetical protein
VVMDNYRLNCMDVSCRALAHDIAFEYGLLFEFTRQKASDKCTGLVVSAYRGISLDTKLETLSAEQFNAMTIHELREMCEYWKMLKVFSCG